MIHFLKLMNYKWHVFGGFLIRIILIIYGTYHDEVSNVSYTDVDYKVFTDAARHVWHKNSPYDRHTYRYSPLIAIILVPNVLLHSSFGKVLFSIIDLMVAILIRLLVKHTIKEYECYKQNFEFKQTSMDKHLKSNDFYPSNNTLPANDKNSIRRRQKKKPKSYLEKISVGKKTELPKSYLETSSDLAMLLWIYNPLVVAIATRGNCDSIAGFFVLLSLYFLQCRRNYFIAGLIHGLSIHFRLYPIAYSLSMFMFLSNFSYYSTNRKISKINIQPFKQTNPRKGVNNENKIVKNLQNNVIAKNNEIHNEKGERKTIFKKEYLLYLLPNIDQLKLITGCLLSLSILTGLFFYLYGYKFLYEAYIYHLMRKDTRHNFSLFFYLQYLTAGVKNIGIWQKILMVLPQIVLLLTFSVRYGLNKFSLNFSILTQTIVMVSYNTVLTSQYFVWILSVLPLCLWQIKITQKSTFFLFIIWFAAQVAWLLPAYFLEFHGQNTFLFIWVQSVSFFCANVAILGRLIMNFMPLNNQVAKSY